MSFSSTLTSPSVPAAEKQTHSMRLLAAHFTFSNMMLRIEVHQTRESSFSESEDTLSAFFLCKFQVFSRLFTEERIEFGYIAINPRSVECCSDICPSEDFYYLHIWSWSSTRVTIRFLFTSLDKVLIHQLLSLARRPDLGRVKLLSLRVTEIHASVNLQCCRHVYVPFPSSVP